MIKRNEFYSNPDSGALRAGLLRAGVSAMALCLAVPAFAQTEPPAATPQDETADAVGAGQDDAIVVTGFRRSLESAQGIKRNSDVVVDSVTAEDISALPDRSVTETLQRIPGVSINRFAAGVDPDHFSVEGSGVVVRGLTYVRSEINARDAFSANNGRGLSFADVPAELLGGVDVFKTPTADRIEGGIAGTVNLRTRLPLSGKMGLTLAGSAELNYGDFVSKSAPTVSALAAWRGETGIGEIGILGSFVYSNLKSRADRFQISSFRIRNLYASGDVIPADGTDTVAREVYFPRGAAMGTQEFDRERYGYSAALQWKSNDGSMEANFQFMRSDARQAWTEHVVEIATDNVAGNGDSRRVTGTTLDFDDSGLFQSGLITGPTGWRGDQNDGAARVPILGLQSNNIRRDHDERLVTDDYGFNFKWDVSNAFGLTFDYQHVSSSTDITDNTLWMSTYQNALIGLNGEDFPTVGFLPPQICNGPLVTSPGNSTVGCSGAPGSANSPLYGGAGHTTYRDPFNSFPRAAMDHIEQSDGNSDAFRLDGEFKFEDTNFLKSIQAGVRYADRDQTARFSTYNWGRLSEQWGNGGPVWLDDPVNGDPLTAGGAPLGGYQPYFFSNFFRNSVDNPLLGEPRLFYSGNTVADYDAYVAYASAINREWEPTVANCVPPNSPPNTASDGVVRNGGWNPLANRCGVIPGTPFLPNEINPIRERNYAAYGMVRFGTEFNNGWNLSGNVGVRYTRTKRTSEGTRSFPLNTTWPTETTCTTPVTPPATLPAFCTLPDTVRQDARDFTNGALTYSVVDMDYEYWLPSVNLKLEVGGGLQFRAAYFKGVAPPSTGLIRNYYPVNLATVEVRDANNTITGYTLQGSFNAGNPLLEPTTADNFDLTAEWYFDDLGQLTIAGFYKRLYGVLTNDTQRLSFTNNGATFDAIVTTPVNSDEVGIIKGFEVAYQQTYDFLPGFLSGLGLQANYTYVDSSGVPQSTLSETDPDVGAGRVTTVDLSTLPLQGLSKHTVNITPFYEKGPLSIRATYSWRSEFLLTIRDVITPFDPIINEATGQVDASIFYAVTPNFKLGVQGSNLLNEVTRTSAVIDAIGTDTGNIQVPRGWYMNDRRFTLIARFNY